MLKIHHQTRSSSFYQKGLGKALAEARDMAQRWAEAFEVYSDTVYGYGTRPVEDSPIPPTWHYRVAVTQPDGSLIV